MAVSNPRVLDLRAASLFDVDPELGELLDERHLAEARPRSIVAVADLAPGPWSPEPLHVGGGRAFAVMVVEGMLLRELLLAGSTATELLGPCDIADSTAPHDELLPVEVRWSVPEAARIVILDDRLLSIMRMWPAVGRALLERVAHRETRLSTHRAIAQLPRVEQRLLAYFGHLGERWGRVAAAGVVIPLHLTHETLGRLIGARRPTVSLALKELAKDNLLARRGDGSWLLGYEAFARVSNGEQALTQWHGAEARSVALPPPPVAEPLGNGHGTVLAERTITANGGDAAPAKPVTRIDMQEMSERIAGLRARHIVAVSDCAAVLSRSRAVRAGRAALPPGRDDSDDGEAAA